MDRTRSSAPARARGGAMNSVIPGGLRPEAVALGSKARLDSVVPGGSAPQFPPKWSQRSAAPNGGRKRPPVPPKRRSLAQLEKLRTVWFRGAAPPSSPRNGRSEALLPTGVASGPPPVPPKEAIVSSTIEAQHFARRKSGSGGLRPQFPPKWSQRSAAPNGGRKRSSACSPQRGDRSLN